MLLTTPISPLCLFLLLPTFIVRHSSLRLSEDCEDYSHSDKKGSGDEELLGFALISKFPSKNMFTFHGFIDSSASYF
ncbi:hypothetical protein AtNW77_Chr5g0096581 [Arabidopsis thaliana]